MQCKKGIYLEKQHRTVPCGQCMQCRINTGRKWSARILMEWIHTTEYAYFLTFTIEPEHLAPIWDDKDRHVGTLQKKSFLLWLKKSRADIGAFRYYAIGEYGDLGGRAHYHLALFPQHPAQLRAICSRWKKGFTSASPLTHKRARYLANYTAKKLTKSTDQRLVDQQEPEFRTSSRNPPLGQAFADAVIEHYKKPKNAELLKTRGDVERTFRLDGKIYPVGDWVLNKIRTGLDIPILDRDRNEHDTYHANFPPLEATIDLEAHANHEKHLNAKKRQTLYRTSAARL